MLLGRHFTNAPVHICTCLSTVCLYCPLCLFSAVAAIYFHTLALLMIMVSQDRQGGRQ